MVRLTLVALICCLAPAMLAAAPPSFSRDVAPVIAKFCAGCHGGNKPKGGVALDKLVDESAALKDTKTWEKVATNLRNGDMPPPGKPRPSATELDAVNAWLDTAVFKIDCQGKRDPGRVTLRRLNRAEYNNTIRDLTGVNFQPADDFPADDVGYGFDNIGDVLSLSPLLLEKYLAAAEKIVEAIWKNAELRRRILNPPVTPDEPLPRNKAHAARQMLRPFAEKAYRRPVTEDELRRLIQIVLQTDQAGGDAGIQVAVQAILVSPHFLFRVENDLFPGKPDFPHRISDFELATRLSYFLWSSMPDEELFRLARRNVLHNPDELAAQVKRMLRDNRSRALTENFASQWLQTRNIRNVAPDPTLFRAFNEKLRDAMQKETELYFEHIVREDRSVLEFIDSNYTFVNEQLAQFYGIPGVKGTDLKKVTLPDKRRGGVLSHASVLTITSNPTRTSPVKRGKWILETLLNSPPPPPPPGVEELKVDKKGELTGTLRQKMEQHRTNAVCASCHQRMDPLGFGFENFDAIGAWRTQEERFPIDASGILPGGQKFNGPAELRAILLDRKEQIARCLAEKLLTYALGRGLERPDRCYVEEIARNLAQKDYKMQALVLEVVRSEPFQMRRAKAR